MVQFMTLVNNTIRKLQLQGEIALLDRESTLRQKFLGVELYDLIEEQHQQQQQQQQQQQKALLRNKDGKKKKKNNNNNNKDVTTTTTTITTLKEDVEKFTSVLAVFRNVERTIQDSLEECRRDIQKLHEGAATTTAALPVPVPVPVPQPLVSVFVNKRKEDFGLAIWPIVSQPQWLHERLGEELEAESMLHNTNTNNTNNKTMLDTVAVARRAFVEGTKTTITKAIGKLSPEERAVEACVDRAKKDVAVLTAEQQQKQNEINELVLGGTTLECCVVMEGAS